MKIIRRICRILWSARLRKTVCSTAWVGKIVMLNDFICHTESIVFFHFFLSNEYVNSQALQIKLYRFFRRSVKR